MSFSLRTLAAIVGSSGICEPLGGLVQEARLDLAEAGLPGQQRQRLGHERLGVREVGEVAAEGERRKRVDRLRDEQAAGAELQSGQLEQPQQRRRRQVLDDLPGEDPAERAVVERLEVRERVRLLDVEALAARVGDHVGVGVDTARLDAGVAEEPEQLAAPAADVEHGRGSRGGRPRRGAGARGRSRSSRASSPRRRSSPGSAAASRAERQRSGQRALRGSLSAARRGPPLEPREPLLELGQRAAGRLLARTRRGRRARTARPRA